MDFKNLDDEAREVIGEARRRALSVSLSGRMTEESAQVVEALEIADQHGLDRWCVYDAIRGTELPRPEQPKPLSLNHAAKSDQYYAQLTADEMKAVDEFEAESNSWTPQSKTFNEARERIAELILRGRK